MADWRNILAYALVGGAGGNPAQLSMMQEQQRKEKQQQQFGQELSTALAPQADMAFPSPTGPGNAAPTYGTKMPDQAMIQALLARAPQGYDAGPAISLMGMQQRGQEAGANRLFQQGQFDATQQGTESRFSRSLVSEDARSAASLQAAQAQAAAQMLNTNTNAQANRENAIRVANIRSNASGGGPAGPFVGNSIEAQDTNVLLGGDPSTPEYHAAYARQANPRVLPDGSRINPDMRPYRQPIGGAYTERPGEPKQRPAGQPSIEPGQLRSARQMRVTMGKLIDNTKSALKSVAPADTLKYMSSGVASPTMTKALTSFQLVLSQLRDPSLLNTGVLQAGELQWINSFMQAPGTFQALLQGDQATVAALDEVMNLLDARTAGFEAIDETRPQPQQRPGDPLAEARAAIARGAPRDKVIERLRANGINSDGL